MRFCKLACVAVLTLVARPGAAQDDKARARALLDTGNAALREGKYNDALERYREAFALYPSPKIRLNIAEVHNQLGQFVMAIEQYEAYLDETEKTTELAKAAMSRRDRLLAKIGRLDVRGPPGALATVDGGEAGPVPVTMRLDPGRHSVRVTLAEHEPYQVDVTVTPGKTASVEATLKPRAPPPPPVVVETAPPPEEASVLQTWWFWTVIGAVVVAGVTTGVVVATTGGDDTLPEGELGTFGTGSWERF